jgi:RES domain-containing protein
MPDADLVARVDRVSPSAFSSVAFRNHGPGYEPTDAGGARIRGGRWNPSNSFPVIYLALSPETAAAEFYRLADRQSVPPENLLPRRLTTLTVELIRVLDLTAKGALEQVGLSPSQITSNDPTACQAVGESAHYLGFEAIRAPSATGIGEILAVFWDRVLPGSSVIPTSHLDWEELPPRPK